ncbi:hypothetical protein CHCC20372_1558 [Bacillus paralicheniformis]|nr:hypothetical protein CHCC20372_1558 [Bacillus paralicheniformis]
MERKHEDIIRRIKTKSSAPPSEERQSKPMQKKVNGTAGVSVG